MRWLAHLLAPFMPSKAAEIWHQLGFEGSPSGDWSEELQWGRLAVGTETRPADAPLFPRIETDAA